MVIDITKQASEELEKVINEKNSHKALRIYIAAYGWGGPSFGLALDESKEGDVELQSGNYKFLVEEDLVDNFGKFTIDYSNNWLKKGFTVIPDRGGGGSC